MRKQLPLETLLLAAVGRRPGTIGMLARALGRHGVSSGSFVSAVRQLEQAGLVYRGASGLYRLSRTGRRRLAFERALARLVGKTATRPRV